LIKPGQYQSDNQTLIDCSASDRGFPGSVEISLSFPVSISRCKQSDPTIAAGFTFWNERDAVALSGAEMGTNFMRA
jgi:hypothetical protein